MSAKKKSDKKSKPGGKTKPKRLEAPKAKKKGKKKREIELPFYRCSNCTAHIEPPFVIRMESCGVAHDDVLISHHCTCVFDADAYIVGRYQTVPMAVAYLFGFSDGFDFITQHGGGGWTYESPLPQYQVHHNHPDLYALREELGLCHTAEDFLRLCEG